MNQVIYLLLFCQILFGQNASFLSTNQRNCKVYVERAEKNMFLYWDGTCKNGKADGKGILQWYSLDDINQTETMKNSLDCGYFFGALHEGKLAEGTYIVTNSFEVRVGLFNQEPSIDFNGVLYEQTKNTLSINKSNKNHKIEGEAFLAYFSDNLYEHGMYKNGERESVLVSYFVETDKNDVCTIVTGIRKQKTLQYQNYYDGMCHMRADLQDYKVYVHQGNAWVWKNDKLYLTKKDNNIQVGTYKNNMLEGEGISIYPDRIFQGIFKNGKLFRGVKIENIDPKNGQYGVISKALD